MATSVRSRRRFGRRQSRSAGEIALRILSVLVAVGAVLLSAYVMMHGPGR